MPPLGFQRLIKEVAPLSFYVHCHAHRLNLVVVAVCTNVRCVMEMLHTLRSLHRFFSAAVPARPKLVRGPVLVAKSSPGDILVQFLKRAAPITRTEYHVRPYVCMLYLRMRATVKEFS